MRGSLKDLINTVTEVPGGGKASIENFMTGLANSGWLKHVKAVLDVSIAIADCILSNRSVIVHCSDGWDRTSQTCALACLMLDGYYRTIQGFQVLNLKHLDKTFTSHNFWLCLAVSQNGENVVVDYFE